MFYNLHTTWQIVLLFLGLAVFAAVSWRWPKLGAWLVIFLAPLYLLKINFWPLTVLEALIWVLVAVWAVRKIKTGTKSLLTSLYEREEQGLVMSVVRNELFWPILLILAGVILATILAVDWRVSFGILKAYFVAPLIFAFIFSDIFDGKEGRSAFLTALAVSATGVGLAAIVYLINGRLTFDGRLTAFYLSPNHLAMWLAPGLIAGFGLWLEVKKTYQRVLLLVIGSLLLVILYFTYSYGAWLGLGAAVVFILFYLRKYKIISGRQLFTVYCLLFTVLVFIFSLQINGGNNEKLISPLTSPRSSWQSRLMIWQSALAILKDHWLVGIGPGLFQQYYLAYQKYFLVPYLEWAAPQPHNLFLSWWLQTGLLGLSGFLWLLVIFFRRGAELLNKIPSWPMIILMAMMVYILIHGLADTPFWKNDLALIWWVVIFLGCRASRRAC